MGLRARIGRATLRGLRGQGPPTRSCKSHETALFFLTERGDREAGKLLKPFSRSGFLRPLVVLLATMYLGVMSPVFQWSNTAVAVNRDRRGRKKPATGRCSSALLWHGMAGTVGLGQLHNSNPYPRSLCLDGGPLGRGTLFPARTLIVWIGHLN